MPNYKYIAQLSSGVISRGDIEGSGPDAVREKLNLKGMRLLSLDEVPARSGLRQRVESLLNSRQIRAVSSRELELLQQQLAVMLESGLELTPSLRELALHSTKGNVRQLCEELAASVERGTSLGDAVKQSKAFPFFVSQLVRVGEESGELAVTLRRAAEFMEKRREGLSGLVAALAYPTFVAVAAFAVAGYLVGWAIPKLSSFLFAMGRKLPPMTQSLIDIADLARDYGPTVGVSTVALLIALICLYLNPSSRFHFDRVILRIPLVGQLVRMAETQLLASSLSLMLRSGVHLQDALRTSSSLHRNRFLARRVTESTERLAQGEALAVALVGFEPLLTSMVAVGERTGELPRALEHVAALYATQLEARLKQCSRLLEPAIIMSAGGVVGYVYVAFFMALMSAGGNFK